MKWASLVTDFDYQLSLVLMFQGKRQEGYKLGLCAPELDRVGKKHLIEASVSLAWSATLYHWKRQDYGMEMIIDMLQSGNSLVQCNS